MPAGAILTGAGLAIVALFSFGSFSRIVTFFVVPFQFMNMLMVSSIYRCLIGTGLTLAGIPVYRVLTRGSRPAMEGGR